MSECSQTKQGYVLDVEAYQVLKGVFVPESELHLSEHLSAHIYNAPQHSLLHKDCNLC